MAWLPDWITGLDAENVRAGEEASRRNRELTEQMHREGRITDDNYRIAVAHYDADQDYAPETPGVQSAEEAVEGAFDTELSERTAAVRDFGTGVVSTGLKSTLGLIPWPVWLALAGYVAWRLGLFRGLLAKVKR